MISIVFGALKPYHLGPWTFRVLGLVLASLSTAKVVVSEEYLEMHRNPGKTPMARVL